MTETTENVTVGSSRTGRRAAPALDISAIIKDPTARIVVCCGAGGVGKTTTLRRWRCGQPKRADA